MTALKSEKKTLFLFFGYYFLNYFLLIRMNRYVDYLHPENNQPQMFVCSGIYLVVVLAMFLLSRYAEDANYFQIQRKIWCYHLVLAIISFVSMIMLVNFGWYFGALGFFLSLSTPWGPLYGMNYYLPWYGVEALNLLVCLVGYLLFRRMEKRT